MDEVALPPDADIALQVSGFASVPDFTTLPSFLRRQDE